MQRLRNALVSRVLRAKIDRGLGEIVWTSSERMDRGCLSGRDGLGIFQKQRYRDRFGLGPLIIDISARRIAAPPVVAKTVDLFQFARAADTDRDVGTQTREFQSKISRGKTTPVRSGRPLISCEI